jgi:hypothetical protein
MALNDNNSEIVEKLVGKYFFLFDFVVTIFGSQSSWAQVQQDRWIPL